MKKRRIQSTLIILFALNALHGQGNSEPGYIVNLSHDTIRGFLVKADEIQNGKSCQFRSGEESDPVNYLPGEIVAYRFTDAAYYVSKNIEVDGAQQMVFAQCLVQGYASLYYFRKKGAELYFIEKEGAPPVMLTDPESMNYIRMLKAAFSDCMEIQAKVDQVKLSHRSLSSVTCQYNEYMAAGQACTVFKQDSRIRLKVAPVIGYSFSSYAVSGEDPFDGFDFDHDNNPAVGLALDLGFSRLGNKFSLQLGADLGKNDYYAYLEERPLGTIETRYYDVYMQGTSLKIYLGARYNFTEGRIRPNLGGGIMFNTYLQPDFWYELETHFGTIVTNTEWHADIASSLFYGAYAQAGVDVDLSRKMILFVNLKGGYCTTNPETIVYLDNGVPDQLRLRSALVPLTLSMGIWF